MEVVEWRVEGGGWRVEGGGWRVEVQEQNRATMRALRYPSLSTIPSSLQ